MKNKNDKNNAKRIDGVMALNEIDKFRKEFLSLLEMYNNKQISKSDFAAQCDFLHCQIVVYLDDLGGSKTLYTSDFSMLFIKVGAMSLLKNIAEHCSDEYIQQTTNGSDITILSD